MKKTIYFIIIFLVTLIIANKISKQFLNQTKFEKSEHIKNLKIIYGEDFEDYIQVYNYQSNAVRYQPLVEFREEVRNSKFVSVGDLGNRCNKNNLMICESPKGGINEIWVFGGSTVFGYGLKNNQTITAQLEKLVKNKRVINFGQGFFNSNQSRIYFQNLLTHLPEPHTAIFLEGFNDFKNHQIVNYAQPPKTALSDNYQKLIDNRKTSTNEKIYTWFIERFNRLNLVRLIKQKIYLNEKNTFQDSININNISNAYIALIDRLKINFKINKSIGEKFGIKVINILEPISLSKNHYSTSILPDSFLINFENDIIHYVKIYKMIEDKNDLLEVVDLNLVNLKIDKRMFIDRTHYSEEFTKEIALKINEKLEF
jgi:hypothetical protein